MKPTTPTRKVLEISRLSEPTLDVWVKRGFVQPDYHGKRGRDTHLYSARQVAGLLAVGCLLKTERGCRPNHARTVLGLFKQLSDQGFDHWLRTGELLMDPARWEEVWTAGGFPARADVSIADTGLPEDHGLTMDFAEQLRRWAPVIRRAWDAERQEREEHQRAALPRIKPRLQRTA